MLLLPLLLSMSQAFPSRYFSYSNKGGPTDQSPRFSLQYCQYKCDVPSTAVFCSESVERFPGTASKCFLKPFVTIPVAPIIIGIILHSRLTFVETTHNSCILFYFPLPVTRHCYSYQCPWFVFWF